MKFSIAAVLLGSSQAVDITEKVETEQLPEGCNGDYKVDEASLVEFMENPDMPSDEQEI